jgi:opacity protein-like surface antigen
MRSLRWAFPALFCASGAANAGSPGLAFSEPVVANFQMVATALWEEQSTYYVGLNLNRYGTTLSGNVLSFSSGNNAYGVDFPGHTSGFAPGIVFGARRMAHGFVVGAELRYNASSAATYDELVFSSGGGALLGPPTETRLSQRSSIGPEAGLRLVVGREMSGMRLYGALGMSAASVTTSIGSDALLNGVPIGMLPSQTRNMVGLHWALGMEVQATERMSVRFEYSRTNYGNFAYNPFSNDSDTPTTHRINAATQRLTVGAIFEF